MRADGTAGSDQREIIGLFHDERAMQTAVDELLIAGFDRASCSLLADPRIVEKQLGHGYEKTAELGDEHEAPRIHYVGRDSRIEAQSLIIGAPGYLGGVLAAGIIAASGGTALTVALGTAGVGLACALLGAFAARYIGRHHSRYLAAQLARGGLLLWVRVKDETQERLAGEILRRHAAEDVRGHDLAAIDYGRIKGGMSRSLSFMNRLGL
ncbi:MAG TPA: hypothetical protein VLA85_19905 [Verrucomicrobiae bacterium]|jgi:hypothetical protein|nr:hypothetical protein [Verrucomicrobiae bacterium]